MAKKTITLQRSDVEKILDVCDKLGIEKEDHIELEEDTCGIGTTVKLLTCTNVNGVSAKIQVDIIGVERW